MTSAPTEGRGRAFCKYLRGTAARELTAEPGRKRRGTAQLSVSRNSLRTQRTQASLSQGPLSFGHPSMAQGLSTDRVQDTDFNGNRNRPRSLLCREIGEKAKGRAQPRPVFLRPSSWFSEDPCYLGWCWHVPPSAWLPPCNILLFKSSQSVCRLCSPAQH